MSMTDPIADLLTRIRNGSRARKEYIECPFSQIKQNIVEVMVAEGFLKDFNVVDQEGGKKDLRVWIRYDKRHEPVLQGLRRVVRGVELDRHARNHVADAVVGSGDVDAQHVDASVTGGLLREARVQEGIACIKSQHRGPREFRRRGDNRNILPTYSSHDLRTELQVSATKHKSLRTNRAEDQLVIGIFVEKV